MKHLIINTILLLFFSCTSFKTEKTTEERHDIDSTYEKYWKGIVLNTSIIGSYISETRPLNCQLNINPDSSGYLLYESKKYNLKYTDTFYVRIDSSDKERRFYADTNIYFKSFNTIYFKNGFILLVNDDNYLMFYKIRDSKGNYIKLPEIEEMDMYLSYLKSFGIEERIIRENFGLKYSQFTKIKYEVPDSIYK